ncbi:MAG TPA: cytochrome c oxidase subunit II [Gaiellaceae bacterium]|nr:cytochrome c oxidase subunit II [Gaiellaceae bacterium]
MRRTASIAALLGALALAAPAYAVPGGIAPVQPESPNADAINTAYWVVLAVTGMIFVLVEAALIVFVIRYRRGPRPRDEEAPQIHGHGRLELIWTVIPVIILAAIASVVFWKLPAIQDVPSAQAAPNRLEIHVIGHQYYWEFRYPGGEVGYDELIVPVDRVVRLTVDAADVDVIHSWWIPSLGGKIDAIPGKTNHTWFRARREGVYLGQCAEFCGLLHAAMLARTRVVSEDVWQRELRGSQDALGKSTFENVCAKCHNLEGPQLVGPNLKGNSILADRAQLRNIVEHGRGKMPPVGAGWSDEQFRALFEYTSKEVAASGG